MRPYKESEVSKNVFIREFKSDVSSDEYIWHKDKEDRVIESLGETDWFIQLDNELPKYIKGKFFIPKETYHRVIKGSGDLKVKLVKLV